MMSKCPTCKKVTDYGSPYVIKGGVIQVTKIECESCHDKRIRSKWKYSKVYHVTILGKGVSGRRSKNTQRIPLFFTPKIPILPAGNQDHIYADVDEFSSELYWIKKGTKVKLSFYWDEYKVLRVKNIGV